MVCFDYPPRIGGMGMIDLQHDIAALHRGVVSLQCGFVRLHRDVAALH